MYLISDLVFFKSCNLEEPSCMVYCHIPLENKVVNVVVLSLKVTGDLSDNKKKC